MTCVGVNADDVDDEVNLMIDIDDEGEARSNCSGS